MNDLDDDLTKCYVDFMMRHFAFAKADFEKVSQNELKLVLVKAFLSSNAKISSVRKLHSCERRKKTFQKSSPLTTVVDQYINLIGKIAPAIPLNFQILTTDEIIQLVHENATCLSETIQKKDVTAFVGRSLPTEWMSVSSASISRAKFNREDNVQTVKNKRVKKLAQKAPVSKDWYLKRIPEIVEKANKPILLSQIVSELKSKIRKEKNRPNQVTDWTISSYLNQLVNEGKIKRFSKEGEPVKDGKYYFK